MPPAIKKSKINDHRKSRNWNFTINNYTDSDIMELSALVAIDRGPSYVVAGKEVGAKGTPHLQCFAHWNGGSGQRFSWLRNHLTRAANIDAMYYHSTRDKCIEYCSKDGDILEFGLKPQPSVQGKRTDLDDLKSAIEEGQPMREVASAHFSPFIKYHRGLEKYAAMHISRRDFKTKVIWIQGPPGCGKSEWAHVHYPNLCSIEYQNGFFSNYQGQAVVLFDDYRHDKMDEQLICRMLDKYPMVIRQIGGWVNWAPHLVIITTNYQYRMLSGRMKRRIEEKKVFTFDPNYKSD